MYLLLAVGLLLSTFQMQALIPEGGERWIAGQSYTIMWNIEDFGSGSVDISLWDGTASKWYPVGSSLPVAIGKFQWRIPQGLHGDYFRIKIQSKEYPDNYMMSSAFFVIISSLESRGETGDTPVISVPSIRITPNPAVENVVISWQDDIRQLTIRNLLGHKVVEYFIAPSTHSLGISIAEWLEGIYMIETRLSNGEIIYGRFLVIH